VPGVESDILNPVKTWAEPSEFEATAKHLVEMFHKNFVNYEMHVDSKVRDAAPGARMAAE
jgi:phosphoenolpyruvate carboxykinase (ATP)